MRGAAQEGRPATEVEERFAALRRLIWLSPDLVDTDKQRIQSIFRNTLTQAGFGAVAMPEGIAETLDAVTVRSIDAVPLKALDEILGEAPPAPLPRISLEEFTRRLSDPSIPEASLRPYLIADERLSKPFAPAFVPNPELVEIPEDLAEAEGLQAMALGNLLARRRRQAAFRIRRIAGDARPVLVSEGDSWFEFPWYLEDVIDCLGEDFSIWSLDAAGDTLKTIADEREYLPALREFRSSVKAFLFSASGNDIIGEDMFEIDGQSVPRPVISQMLRPFAGGLTARDYFDTDMFRGRIGFIEAKYAEIFAAIEAEFPELPVICHGYDYAIPALATGETRKPSWVQVDYWLGGPFRRDLLIADAAMQQEIVRLMIDELNLMLKRLCGGNNSGGRFRNAWHVDVRGTLGMALWADEVHPTDAGYKLVAAKFRDTINAALGV
ncbi:MAG: hypothetical protein HC850_03090 [Rhodomicrobium sp.]|nr:hypothetical protein [Rhodomicrobium sp.]